VIPIAPRLPVDGVKVQELRITLGTKERQLLQDVSTSYRIQSLDIDGMLSYLEDPVRIVQIAYGIATVLEMFGIETGLPTVGDLPELIQWLREKREYTDPFTGEPGRRSFWDVLTQLWTGELVPGGSWPGGY